MSDVLIFGDVPFTTGSHICWSLSGSFLFGWRVRGGLCTELMLLLLLMLVMMCSSQLSDVVDALLGMHLVVSTHLFQRPHGVVVGVM